MSGWWVPLCVGVLVRQVADPAFVARMARSVRPRILAWVARSSLSTGSFDTEPSALAPLHARLSHAIEHALPTLIATSLTLCCFAWIAARHFSFWWLPAAAVSATAAMVVRIGARRSLAASSQHFLEALRTEAAHLHAAALAHLEVTGEAREYFVSTVARRSLQVSEAERTHAALTRVVRSAQIALLLAPLAWVLWHRGRLGVAITLRDLCLVVPAILPCLSALRSVDEIAVGHSAYLRLRHVSDVATHRSAPDTNASLCVRNVTVRYDNNPALLSVCLTLLPHGVTAIIGPNGAGKSTLARVIAGAHIADEGDCLLGTIATHHLPSDVMALVPQQPCFILSLSVLDNVRIVVPHATVEEVVTELSHLGFSTDVLRPMSSLSRGEQRRVAIARALLRRPRWLILDEPDAWLDHQGREQLHRHLSVLAKDHAIVIVTHRADLVSWADQLVVLSAEHTVEAAGKPETTLPGSPTGRALLASLADESLRFRDDHHDG
jgi:ABC-type transport system involved in cytochrome bd biosynthesis fused ATPase/permease subunit